MEKSRSAIPSIVTKCLTEIEKRGIMIKVSLQKNNTLSYDRISVQKIEKKPKFCEAILSPFWVFFVLIMLTIYFGV